MYAKLTDMEEGVFKAMRAGREVSLERGLLIASGLRTEREIGEYRRKLDAIQRGFEEYRRGKLVPRSQTSTAKLLNTYFWDTKPDRYNGNFLLPDVIDAQLSPERDQKVGNCVGLTSLYSVMGTRLGLDLSILVSKNHVKNRLRDEDGDLPEIENTRTYGFRLASSENEGFEEFPLSALIGVVYESRGYRAFKSGNYVDAAEEFTRAIEFEPDDADLYRRRSECRFAYGDIQGGFADEARVRNINFDRLMDSLRLSPYSQMKIEFPEPGPLAHFDWNELAELDEIMRFRYRMGDGTREN